jgi:hypothetical protein
MNHAYINTGVIVEDMSKLSVECSTFAVDKDMPLYRVNSGYGYVFGSESAYGSFYIRYNNQTMYGNNLSGVDKYEAKAGLRTNETINASTYGTILDGASIVATTTGKYSLFKLKSSTLVETENARMIYPLYLFANNSFGSYKDGIAGIGIRSCKITYDGELIRNFIPVKTYDLIGTQVAPSNCLYDKVTKTFFEDATGLNSFNIIDDEDYPDLSPFNIGSFYVQYYKNGTMFASQQVYFRNDEISSDPENPINAEYDLMGKINVEGFRPMYYGEGEITNLYDLTPLTFDTLNGFVFRVEYAEQAAQITVNYYRDAIDENNLIISDTLSLKESDFLQAPTFGDIVRLNKYLPQGY